MNVMELFEKKEGDLRKTQLTTRIMQQLRAKHPQAQTDLEAVLLDIHKGQRQDRRDISRLDQENDREDFEIDRLDREVDNLTKITKTGGISEDDISKPRHPQELDYQQGPEDDEEYRRHHGLGNPDRKRERRLRATDHETLDRLERQALARAKQIGEAPNEGNEFSGELAKAKASGANEFEVDGKTYPVRESSLYRAMSAGIVSLNEQEKKKLVNHILNSCK